MQTHKQPVCHVFCLVWRAAAEEKAATLAEYSPQALKGKNVVVFF